MTIYHLEYKNETIENITWQSLEKEVLDKIEGLRVEAIDNIESMRDEANSYITNEKNNPYYGVVKRGDEINGDITFKDGDNIDSVITSTKNKGILGDNYMETKKIYEDTCVIAENTIEEITDNTIKHIVDNKYTFSVATDANGNTIVEVVKEV